MTEILLEFFSEEEYLFESIISKYPKDVDLFSSEGFTGFDQLSQFVATLTPVLIPSVAGVIVALINAQKSFKVRIKTEHGAEFEFESKGFNTKKAKDILSSVSDQVSADSPTMRLLTLITSEVGEQTQKQKTGTMSND